MTSYSRDRVLQIELPANMPMSQTNLYERQVLYWLASEYFSGIGEIVDAGCLVGGSTFHFLRGVRDNARIDNKTCRVHAYDYFPGTNHAKFKNNLREFEGMYVSYKGKLNDFSSPEKVEILFIDIAKDISTWRDVCRIFLDSLIPGRTIIYQQDFCRPRLPWLYYSTGFLLDSKKISILEPDYNSFFYVLNEQLSESDKAKLANDDFTIAEKSNFIDTLEQHVCAEDNTLDADTRMNFSAILALSKTYLEFYFGDKNRAREQAELLSHNSFLKEEYSWMFGELSVPGFPAYHYNVAKDLLSNGQFEKAFEENSIALANAKSGSYGRIYTPHIFDLHHQRSRILTGLGRIDDAIYSELEAIETNKNCSHFYHALGNLYKQKGDLKNAEKAQLDAINRDPNSSQPFFQLSIIYNQKGELRKAIQYAKSAISLNGENPNYHHHYGNLLAKHGDYKEAEQAQLKTIELNPDIPGAYFQLSTIYNQQGDLEKAVSRAKEALALKENNPFFHRHLGNLLKKYGDIQGSELAYARADELSA